MIQQQSGSMGGHQIFGGSFLFGYAHAYLLLFCSRRVMFRRNTEKVIETGVECSVQRVPVSM